MTIYIKGVDIPTNCTDCRYRPLVGCNPYQDNGLSPSDHRHRTCPITEVPEPHGRLIDLDALIDQISIDSAGNRGQYGDEWLFEDTIEKAPTIIEKSENDDI